MKEDSIQEFEKAFGHLALGFSLQGLDHHL
jgi:hypothetical protein